MEIADRFKEDEGEISQERNKNVHSSERETQSQRRRGSLISFASQHIEEDEDPSNKDMMEEKSITDQNKEEEETEDVKAPENPGKIDIPSIKQARNKEDSDEEDTDYDEEDHDSSAAAAAAAVTEGLYDPNEFVNLPVGSDIKELFQFISAYTPQVIETESMLRPFILDYIPSVGDIDAFIKIPRPDDVEDNLGLIMLDEPCAKQSDPTVLDLHLRAASKDNVHRDTVVKKLARADRNPREIESWIKSIATLHKSKPATQVHYSKPMPDIDSLMQEWPPEVEETLKQIDLPSADLELMPLEQYVDTACAILDIPVYKSRIQSLHVLFTLYSEFKNSQHFRALAEENRMETVGDRRGDTETADRLVL